MNTNTYSPNKFERREVIREYYLNPQLSTGLVLLINCPQIYTDNMWDFFIRSVIIGISLRGFRNLKNP